MVSGRSEAGNSIKHEGDARRPPTPAQLVVSFLSAAAPAPVAVAMLVEAVAVFGHTENVVRVTLSRLRARGTVELVHRGEYTLSVRGLPVQDAVASWRRDDASIMARWDGKSWFAFLGLGARAPAVVRLLGFEAFIDALWVRPANRRGGLPAVRGRALEAGCAAPAFRISDLGPELESRAVALWDVAGLTAGQAALTARLEASSERLALATGADDDALRETYALGSEAIRALALDPLLPEELCPAASRRALRRAMVSYDQLGKRLWSARLERGLRGHAPVWVGAGAG